MKDVKQIIAIAEACIADNQRGWSLLSEAYDYFEPMRGWGGDMKLGADRQSDIFTTAGIDALRMRTNLTFRRLFPVSSREPWFELQFRPVEGQVIADIEGFERQRQAAEKKVHEALQLSNFSVEILPSLRDALLCMGVIWAKVGTKDNPLQFQSGQPWSVSVEENGQGSLDNFYMSHNLTAQEAVARWPEGKFDGLDGFEKSRSSKSRRKRFGFIECIMPIEQSDESANKKFKYEWVVIAKKTEKIVFYAKLNGKPLIAFREDKCSGETIGRGLALEALPALRVANTARGDVLGGLRLRVMGLFQSDDDIQGIDGGFVGGEVVQIPRGSSGITAVNLPQMGAVDSQILSELEGQIRHSVKGPSLPDEAQGARSDLDLHLRKSESDAASLPMSLRLLKELVVPLVERCVEILSSPEMAGSPYHIALPEGVHVVAQSPFVRAQERLDALSTMESLQVAMQIDPQGIARRVKVDAVTDDFLRKSGFSEEHFRTEDELAEYDEKQQQTALAQVAASGVTNGAG